MLGSLVGGIHSDQERGKLGVHIPNRLEHASPAVDPTAVAELYVAHWRELVRLGVLLLRDQPASQTGSAASATLTAREEQVVARGHTNQQIAQELLISTSTVKNHMRQILFKLGVSDRTQAAIMAIEAGLHAEDAARAALAGEAVADRDAHRLAAHMDGELAAAARGDTFRHGA
jgi:DNA-binding CsgD family transcriptional regulator